MSGTPSPHSVPRTDAPELVDRINWYVACLEAQIKGNVVCGLAEAEAGFDSAMDEVTRLEEQLETAHGQLTAGRASEAELRQEWLDLKEQFDAMEKVARLLWQFYLLPMSEEQRAFVRSVLEPDGSNPASAPDPAKDSEEPSGAETLSPAKERDDG